MSVAARALSEACFAACVCMLTACGRADAGRDTGAASRNATLRADTPTARGPEAFEEVAWETGLYDLAAGWGLSWHDADGDGDPDLFVSNHMHYPSVLYLNSEGLRFERGGGDLGRAVDLDDHLGVWADIDADGFADLFTTSGYYRDDHLMRNRGDGTFVDVAAEYGLTLGHEGRGRSAVWSDFSGDGWLDLLVVNLYTTDLLYVRDPEHGFRETGRSCGVANSLGKEGAAVGDIDGDGDQDIYLPVFQGSIRDLLFLNRGDGTFVERSTEAGVDIKGVSRSASFGDYDGDGRIDLYVTRGDGDVLFRNRGDGTFEDVTAAAGINVVGRGIRNAGFTDLDNDGWLDLYVTCGGSHDGPDAPNFLLHNKGDGTFEDRTDATGLAALSPGNSASLAFADFDLDGFVDIAATNGGGARAISGPHLLFRNPGTNGNGWMRILPRGGRGNSDGIGAAVRVILPDGRSILREAGGTRVMAQDEAGVHAGLGRHDHAREVRVSWPDGGVAWMQGVPSGQTTEVAVLRAPRWVASHPAALLGNVPTFDLEAALARARDLLPGPLPAPDQDELDERTDDVLAWALCRELARELEVSASDVASAWKGMRAELDLPERYLVEHIGIGKFTTFAIRPRKKNQLARDVAEGMRGGRDLLELSLEHGIRAWARVYKADSDATEPALGEADETTRGYIESGWLTRAMLVERYGEEHTEKIVALDLGEVYGPIELREGRDVQEPELVWPLLRLFRMADRRKAERADAAQFEPRVRRALRRRKLAELMAQAAAPHATSPESERYGWFEGVRYEVGRLAAAARERGLDEASDVRAAIARATAEAELDAAARKIVSMIEPSADEIAELVSARQEVWTRPERVSGTKLFFALRDEAEEARRQLAGGATVEEVVEQLTIPPLSVPDARGKVSHFEQVTWDRALWQRVAPKGSFSDLTQLAPHTISEILDCANGFIVFAAEQVIAPEPMEEREARERAGAELRRRRAEAAIDALLWTQGPQAQRK